MTFNVGDLAVYPKHGLGVVKGVENREIAGNRQTFYILKILETGMTIMVPTTNARENGMRSVIDQTKVVEVYEILRQRDIPIDNQTWNRRRREYLGKIMSGSIYEIAKVLRDLSLLKCDKTLSFGERQMLDTARNLLVKEISVAMNTAEEVIENELHGIFQESQATA